MAEHIINFEKNTEVNVSLIEISLLVWDKYILIDDKKIPLGQWSTEILNLDINFINKIIKANSDIVFLIDALFNEKYKKDFNVVSKLQKIFNETLDVFIEIPPYKYFVPKKYGRTVLIDLFQNNEKYFYELCCSEPCENNILYEFIYQFFSIFSSTLSFIANVTFMLEGYFENLEKRNNEHYAFGVFGFFFNTEVIEKIRNEFPALEEFNFQSVEKVGLEYTATKNPDAEGYILAERIVVNNMKSLLHIDFFKGLVQGNCPRRCHNCGTYFLLLSGHNTCYCTNPISEQKNKNKILTCRDVGAHNKEREQKENRTPARQEYDKVYNRLKTRKNRKRISSDEFNIKVEEAWQYKIQNENGSLSDFNYKELMNKF